MLYSSSRKSALSSLAVAAFMLTLTLTLTLVSSVDGSTVRRQNSTSSSTAPSSTNSSTAPSSTISSTAPTSTNSSTAPSSANSTTNSSTAPSSTNSNTAPSSTNSSTAPSSTNSSTAHSSTNSSTAPTSAPTAGLYKYVIVLDAGSTHTKANVFKFDVTNDVNQQQQQQQGNNGKGNTTAAVPLSVTELSVGKIEVKPGLDKFAHDSSPDDLRNYFTPLFSALASVAGLPSNETALYFLGQKQLQKQDAKKAEKLKADIQAILSNKTLNPYVFSPGNFRVISGGEKAAYAWVAANFLNEVLRKDDIKNSVGIAEMGDSSFRLAFLMPQSLRQLQQNDVCDVTVNGQVRKLGVDSFPGYGAKGIVKVVLDKACESATNGTASVLSPCLLTGDSRNTTCGDDARQVTVKGTSGRKQCSKMLENLVERTVSGHYKMKSMLFYGLGAMRYSLQTLKLVDGVTGVLNQNGLDHQTKQYCVKTFKDAAATFKVSGENVSDYCIHALLLDEILDELDLDDNEIKVSQTLQGKTISWALGAAVDFAMSGGLSLRCNGQ